ncbi:HTH-type transcriptional regulator MalT [compost metagenome]
MPSILGHLAANGRAGATGVTGLLEICMPKREYPMPPTSSPEAAARDAQADRQGAAGATHGLVRQVLVEQMGKAGSARLILVHAAAGFGKSTLLRQYREHCRILGRQTAWLALDSGDNDLSRFLSRLDGLLRTLDGGEDGCESLAGGPESAYTLLESIAARQQPLTILLDDFEVLQNPSVISFVQQVLGVLPPGGCLAIASRTVPELGLGRLRVRGQLLEVNPNALRFSPEETAAFLRVHHRLALGDDDVAELHRCTEGWITALQMAAISLRGCEEPAAFIASFSGSNLDLGAYLAEQVVARQSEECRRFLLQTSVLGRFCAPLCDALTGRGDSQEMIDHLLRTHLFLFPVDDGQRWFRYHSLFAAFLVEALERQTPGAARELHRAAARWYFEANEPIPAIDHLFGAGDVEEAVRHLGGQLDTLVRDARSRLLVRWLGQVPMTTLIRRPRLRLVYGWALILGRRFAEARRLIEEGGEGLESDSINFVLLALSDRMDEACEVGSTLLERLSTEDYFHYGLVANTLAFVLLALGRHEEARRLLLRVLPHVSQYGANFMRNVAASVECILDLAQGRLANAQARLQAVAQQSGDRYTRPQLSLDMLHAVVLYELDELDRAQRLLGETLTFTMDVGVPDALISSHVLLARMAWLDGDKAATLRYLHDLETIGNETGSSRSLCSVWMERVRQAILEGRLDAAAQAMRQVDRHSGWDRPGVLMYPNDVDYPVVARMRLRIAQGQFAAAAEGLRDALADAEARGLVRRGLKLRLLHAMAVDGLGRKEEAFAVLTEALRLASHEGFLRTFLEEGPRLADLLRRWAVLHQPRSSSLGIVPAFLADLLKRLGRQADPAPQDAAADDTRETLTRRELQIIRALADGQLIPEIARTMFVSENTVKTHIRNISVKLGAHSRNESLAIARARGLLD